ncbi:class I SAM-dependent methyltransferase [Nanoarchaeota archaeon]
MTHEDNVQAWYSLLGARWYNPFKAVWTWAVCRKAEREFVQLLKENGKGMRILELGCGTGINIGRLLDNGVEFKSYLGYDFNESMLRISRKRFGDVKNVSLEQKDVTKKVSGKHDIIISTWVFSLLEDRVGLVKGKYANLTKGGRMFLIFLTKPKWYIHFWMFPWIWFFAARYVSQSEIDAFPGRKKVRTWAGGITTLVEIQKA